MKRLLNQMRRRLSFKVIKIRARVTLMLLTTRDMLCSQRGEGFVDTAVKILISVVIGALILAGLYALFGDTIMPQLKSRITEMFNYGN